MLLLLGMTTTSRTRERHNSIKNTIDDDQNHEKIVSDLFIKKDGPFFGFCIKGGIYKPLGIYVTKIDQDGVADKAGLRVDDEILRVNDQDFSELKIHEALEYLLHLKSAHLRIRRRPDTPPPPPRSRHLDANTNDNNDTEQKIEHSSCPKNNDLLVKIQIARSTLFETFGFTVKSLIENDVFKKLFVTSILEGSAAEKSQLDVGDEIVEVNDRMLHSASDFYDVVHIFRHALVLVLLVRKKNKNKKNHQTTRNVKNEPVESSIMGYYEEETAQVGMGGGELLDPAEPLAKSSCRRLESIINQLTDDEEEVINEDADSTTTATSETTRHKRDMGGGGGQIYQRKSSQLSDMTITSKNSQQSIENKCRYLKQLKQSAPAATSNNNYDNNTNRPPRSRTTSIQNMLDALRMASNCGNGGGSNGGGGGDAKYDSRDEDEDDVDDGDGDDEIDQSMCSLSEESEEFRQEMLRRAQDWQVPFVASTTSMLFNTATAATAATADSVIDRVGENEKASSTSPVSLCDHHHHHHESGPTKRSFVATSKYILANSKPVNNKDNQKQDEAQQQREVDSRELNSPMSLLPCSCEIWLPDDEDSLLNIESEAIIPEAGLSTQLVLDYEYKYAHAIDDLSRPSSNNNNNNNNSIGYFGLASVSKDERANSIRYGTYKSKANPALAELKPDGVVLIRVVRTAQSSARFGLRLRRDGNDFVVNSVELGTEAHRLGLFQVGQTIVRINQTDSRFYRTPDDCERFMEDVYRQEKSLEISVKLKN